MNSTPRYFVQLDGQVNGPYRLEQLRELAVGMVIKPTTLAALGADGPWWPMESLPELAPVFSRRTGVAFKDPGREVGASSDGRGIAMADIMAAAQVAGPVLRANPALVPPADNGGRPLNDVQHLVRAVQATEAAFAPPVKLPPKRGMSRSFKYVAGLWVLLILVLLAIRLGYAARWDEASTTILVGWGALGHGLLVGVYVLFRRTES